MKTIGAMLLVLTTLVFFCACGGEYKLKVEGLDEEDEGTEEQSQADGEDTDGTADDGEMAEGGGGQGSDDTTGGLEYLERDNRRETSRYFMGTYTFLQNSYYNGFEICKHGFPLNVRLYSHDDVIDFESSTGDLFSIANLYEDDTFDFEVVFLDRFGDPSIDVACTCVIQDAYYDYRKERIGCGCEPSNDNENCSVIYEKLNFDDY